MTFQLIILAAILLVIQGYTVTSHRRRYDMRGVSLDMKSDLCFVVDPAQDSFFKKKPTLDAVSWGEVLVHECDKMAWDYPEVKMEMLTLSDIEGGSDADAAVVVVIGVRDPVHAHRIKALNLFKGAHAVVTKECSHEVAKTLARFDVYDPDSTWEPLLSRVDSVLFKKSRRNVLRQVFQIGSEVWNRQSSDDLLFALQCYIDTFSEAELPSVRAVTTTDETGLGELRCMCSNCLDEIQDCFTDPTCLAALECLNRCKGNDQVCSYRCITSYETPAFEKFALCILQKHNCLNNAAVIPTLPDPTALPRFRGEPLSHETAEGILQGWLDLSQLPEGSTKRKQGEARQLVKAAEADVPWSWKVVCGQNPAYDFFGCQHQLFYPKDGTKGMWYDPVFKVDTLAGEEVWRRRHYSVRTKADSPGKFFFSVLDNGVMSNEYWRVLDVADDLSWGVLYYSGAASAAGTSYRGALLVTKDGLWPQTGADEAARIEEAFNAGGIKMWELFPVPNEDCGERCNAGPPPLGVK